MRRRPLRSGSTHRCTFHSSAKVIPGTAAVGDWYRGNLQAVVMLSTASFAEMVAFAAYTYTGKVSFGERMKLADDSQGERHVPYSAQPSKGSRGRGLHHLARSCKGGPRVYRTRPTYESIGRVNLVAKGCRPRCVIGMDIFVMSVVLQSSCTTHKRQTPL